MNTTRLKGNWKQFKGKIKQQWGKLTDDDLLRIEGNAEELAGAVQSAYGTTKEEAQRQVASFHNQCGMGCEDNDPRALEDGARPKAP